MCQINHQFLPRKPRFDFDMLKMFFSFQFTKYDENRWLNTKLFFLKKRCNSPKKTIRLFCTFVRLVTSDGSILLVKSIGAKVLYSDTVYC